MTPIGRLFRRTGLAVGQRLGSTKGRARVALVAVGVVVVASTSIVGGASPASAAAAPSGAVNIVAYSVPAPAYAAQIKAFNKTKQGKNVTFSQSYGASGSQAKAVVAGQPADLVNFASATDMETLLAANLVDPNWAFNPQTKGMVTDSVVAFVVPKGNPEHIKGWPDLLKPGVRIFTPNPFSSGAARWNIMAAYGAELKLGKTPAEAQHYLQQFLKNTVVQSTSAANELQAFLADQSAHKSDVLLDYESDTIQAIHAGTKISYVIPKQDILIENPIAVTTNAKNRPAAKAFYNYLLSAPAQKLWAKLGYRPVLASVAAQTKKQFPTPPQLFTIDAFGGWDQVNSKFFSTTSSSPGIVTQIEASLGQATSK